MRIGIIFTGFNTQDLIHQSLAPWIQVKKNKQRGHEFVIVAVSLPFIGFPVESIDETTDILRHHSDIGDIDYLITEPHFIPETMARGMALQYIKEQECDISWQADSDEIPTISQINSILNWVEQNPFVAWFRLSLKNFVLDNETYLADPFQPPRIHCLNLHGHTAHSFSADNDIQYGGRFTRDILSQDHFPSQTIPPECAWIRHESWPNSPRSKAKILYQTERWGNVCSFSWDDSQGGLIFNPALPKPKVIVKEES